MSAGSRVNGSNRECQPVSPGRGGDREGQPGATVDLGKIQPERLAGEFGVDGLIGIERLPAGAEIGKGHEL